MTVPQAHFTSALFAFLRELKQHNDRTWFAQNKPRFERDVRVPLLAFIADFSTPLARVAPSLVADARPSGGSMFRIHRDTRFSKDKSPYKTHVAAQFRHREGRDVHAPGLYLHLEPGLVMFGAGVWHPDPDTLQRLRSAVAADPKAWRASLAGKAFQDRCTLEGESAIRVPRGFDGAHPCIEDIKRKDFVAMARLTQADAVSPGFLSEFVSFAKAATPLMRFLTRATGLEY